MTSMNIADGLVIAAKHAATVVEQTSPASSARMPNNRQIATVIVVMGGLIIGLSRLRKFRIVRLGLLTSVILVLGLLNGDMLSQATLIGWTQNDVPWAIATGLVTVSIAAFVNSSFLENSNLLPPIVPSRRGPATGNAASPLATADSTLAKPQPATPAIRPAYLVRYRQYAASAVQSGRPRAL